MSLDNRCHLLPNPTPSLRDSYRKDRKELLNTPPIWKASKGYASFLSIEMGQRIPHNKLDGSTIEVGSTHLWVKYCLWTLIGRDGQLLLNSLTVGNNAKSDNAALNQLVGSRITFCTEANGKVEIIFSNGMRLYAERDPEFSETHCYMTLFHENGLATEFTPKDGFREFDPTTE